MVKFVIGCIFWDEAFIGNLEMAGQTLDVVAGQQRLTIITILFSAISDHFREIRNLIFY